MNKKTLRAALVAASLGTSLLHAAPTVSRLTPPSALFTFGDPGDPYISRFLPGQRFDLQATVSPDAGQTITNMEFYVGSTLVPGAVTLSSATVAGLPASTRIGTLRAYANTTPGAKTFSVVAYQSDGQTVSRSGNFEVVAISQLGRRAKNIIVCIGDGMGIAHRTAARLMRHGASLGKANDLLAMDKFPNTGIVITHSLNSIVTDSSPGAACYSTGNKSNNNQHGVFPDDTTANFDNPRVENIGEYLSRTGGKSLGIVATSDVFDATPASFATHTQSRGAGTGICDQYLDESSRTGLRVLLGGGRKWFLPATTPGSARTAGTDYVLPADVVSGWGVAAGTVDTNRDLISDFASAGWTYAADRTALNAIPANTDRLLGLFTLSNMQVAKDKIDGRRGVIPPGASQTVVSDFGFPNQPMLDEMTDKALQVLNRNPNGFILMVEAASIDKQAHNMDTERWILDTLEFDYAVERCRQFALANPDTLVIVTADHECAGINIIGGSRVSNATLVSQVNNPTLITNTVVNVINGVTNTFTYVTSNVRNNVGTYESAGFPFYTIQGDGYPVTTDPDRKMVIGYAASATRFEDLLTNPYPLRDGQQPLLNSTPQTNHPAGPLNRDLTAGANFILGQVPDPVAAHTASDVPVSALGRGASLFNGVMDNTDVFFRAMQAALGGSR
jgi:alkaline phosphatase